MTYSPIAFRTAHRSRRRPAGLSTAALAPIGRVLDTIAAAQRNLYPKWHHASPLQASVAESVGGYGVRFTTERGWEVWATDADFDQLVNKIGETL